jgi:hypothetical protein
MVKTDPRYGKWLRTYRKNIPGEPTKDDPPSWKLAIGNQNHSFEVGALLQRCVKRAIMKVFVNGVMYQLC